ncbi:MAG TPA: sigma factor-like helix-turn-helix DNA-binding protein [Solirubrobacteraceae bacterium]|nr:sigma factor-like helix-turn-helix DNA-binding protein [Solirubrobacteraceae bacterium]
MAQRESRRHRLHARLRSQPAASESDLDVFAELPDAGLAQALRLISPLDREALLLTYWEELSPADAAQALGCSRAAFAVRLHRTRRRLRRQLEVIPGERSQDQPHERSCATETESV